ncbi:pyridoxal phosphate-dependent decarboxylase family protein [Salibacterium aidingense]|uniref:pyridoxal phosphate-dependent decarboxylase family protein n=1 Tax=Salibacterium aidingense TaxID=384933 RepID=UPI003BD4726A
MAGVSEQLDEAFVQGFMLPGNGPALQSALHQTAQLLSDYFDKTNHSYSGLAANQLDHAIGGMLAETEEPHAVSEVLGEVRTHIMSHSLNVNHPHTAAHLQCPPLIPSVCADTIASALNQSLDSWDQSPAATVVEQHMTEWLCRLFQFPESAGGTFTTGGTQSNYMGLLLARDHYCLHVLGRDVKKYGLPPKASRFKILCSEEAHFTVKKSAAQLGLGEEAVILIPADNRKKMDARLLEETIHRIKAGGDIPMAVVGTAGTTDFGSIDPLEQIGAIAAAEKIWLHVDAAYAGALALSSQYAGKLRGITQADSISVDFHKLFYQPISCGAFLVKKQSSFQHVAHPTDYLNPDEDKEDGIVNLVDHSIQTTKRFDALKVLVTLKTIGTRQWGQLIDQSISNAAMLAEKIEADPSLHLVMRPEMNAVVFRYCSQNEEENGLHRRIQQHLYHSGEAAIAKTKVNGVPHLKCTLLHPCTTEERLEQLVQAVVNTGRKLEKRKKEETV